MTETRLRQELEELDRLTRQVYERERSGKSEVDGSEDETALRLRKCRVRVAREFAQQMYELLSETHKAVARMNVPDLDRRLRYEHVYRIRLFEKLRGLL